MQEEFDFFCVYSFAKSVPITKTNKFNKLLILLNWRTSEQHSEFKTKCLRQTLVFMWNSAPQKQLNFKSKHQKVSKYYDHGYCIWIRSNQDCLSCAYWRASWTSNCYRRTFSRAQMMHWSDILHHHRTPW